MSDAQFRLLIQRSFDEELTKQEHRSLVNHLETSESGQKFHHQLEQMIQASQDSPLPDELHPQNPEALAKRIIEQMPQKKTSFLSMFAALFGGGIGGNKNAGGKSTSSKPMGKGPAGRPPAGRGSKPAKAQDPDQDLAPSARPPKGGMFRKQAAVPNQEETENQAANFSRLKSIGARGEAQQDSREAQSTTRSLGEKFGMPGASMAGADEGPLTLAESIRRKVSESQKLSPVEEADMSGSFEEPNHDVFARTQPAMEPPQHNAAISAGFSNAPSAADWMAPGQTPNLQSKSSIGLAPPGGQVAGRTADNSFTGNNPDNQPSQSPSWGTAPAGTADATPPSGQVGWGHAANQEAAANQGAPGAIPDNTWGSGWNNPETEGRAPLKSSDSWAMPDQASSQDGNASTGWGDAAAATGPAPYNNTAQYADPAPQANPQPVSDPGGWGGWGGNAQDNSPAPQSQGAVDNAGQSPAAWGHQANQQGQAQENTNSNPGGWGSADSWSAPSYQAQNQSAPAPSSDPWSQTSQADNQPFQADMPATAGSAAAPAADPWSQASAIGAADSGISAPISAQTPSVGGWGNSSQGQAQGAPASNAGERPSWSMEAEQMETGTWTAFKPGSGALNAGPNLTAPAFGAPASPTPPAQQAAASASDRWDLPIQERNKTNESMDAPRIPTQPAAPNSANDNRWDVPIQERGQNPSVPETPLPASNNQIPVNQIVDKMGEVLGGQASQSASTTGDTRWDVPIQERNKQTAAPEATAAQAPSGWGAPAAPVTPVSGGWGDVPAPPAAPVSSGWGDAPVTPVAPVSSGWGDVQSTPVTPVSGGWGETPSQAPNLSGQPAPQVTPTNPIAGGVGGASSGGMFNLDDSAMDKIFNDNLGVSEPINHGVVNQGAGEAPLNTPAPQPAAPAFRDIPVPNQTFEASPPAPPAMPTPPINAVPQTKGLFNLSDSDLDRVFEQNLGIPDESVASTANANAGWSQAPQPLQAAQAATTANPGWGVPAPAPAAAAGNGGWAAPAAPNSGWAQPPQPAPDTNSGWAQPPAPPAPPAPLPEQAQNFAQNQFDPGAPAPKIEGIGRLDASADTSNDTGSGRIAAIGKFLLDQKDYDKIGKLTSSDNAEGKLRVLTNEASQDLQALLGQIGGQQGVIGSVIVGHDGLIIANTMPGNMDAESMGVWALGVFMNTQHVVTKMGHERVHQVVSRTPRGFVVIADFGGGLLVTVTDGQSTDQLIPLMRTITQLVN